MGSCKPYLPARSSSDGLRQEATVDFPLKRNLSINIRKIKEKICTGIKNLIILLKAN